jgi:glycosyltransferase involved in cell wall biosynthesis
MKILFLVYHGLSNYSGISKKILEQVKGLKENGHKVHLCTYIVEENGHRKRIIDNQEIEDLGTGIMAKLKKRCCYSSILGFIRKQHIELVYVRSFHNANPFTIHLFKQIKKWGIKAVMEIPTYPYDAEYAGADRRVRLNLTIDKLYRRRLAKQMTAIVTYADTKKIFGQRTICISNGIDFSTLPLRVRQANKDIHLIGVAEVHYWHGYDRVIHGIGEYYKRPHDKNVYFHIVGGVAPSEMYDTAQAPGFDRYIKQYDIEKQIIFHGQKYGKELDELFNAADFAIGSLARHRTKIDKIKTLKNREYAARGIPFIYSETDEDFDRMPYVLKAPADESPVSIQAIIQFYEALNSTPEQIRASIKHLSWRNQMEQVINEL